MDDAPGTASSGVVAIDRLSRRLWPVFVIACLWVPALFTFSWPGRLGPVSMSELDLIAVAKAAARAATLLVALLVVTALGNTDNGRRLARVLLPLAVFVTWALLSTLWSPLPTVSLGQAIGLGTLFLTAAGAALLTSDERDASSLCFHLAAVLLVGSALLLVVYGLAPEMSGMFGPTGPEAPGLIHPTAAAATASLGLLIVLTAAAFPRWVWARRWLLPMLVVQGLAVYVAQRRTAVALVAALVPGIFWFSVGRRARTVAVVAILIAAVAYVASDTRLVRLSAASSAVASYLRRGASPEDLRSLNGRAELWGKMANQVTKAPLIGHGYFVTCEAGEIEVWGWCRAITAHNVLLQVLASTGIIGLLLFLWGLWRPIAMAARGLRDQGLRNLLVVMLLFYLGWGMLTDSFMGPVRAESIVFFALLGVAVARTRPGAIP